MPYPLAPINVTASKTITPSHTGTITTINAAAGLTLTLPAATGTGYKFMFFVGTTVTSNTVVLQVVGLDIMSGVILAAQDAADTVTGWETAADSDTITLNGTTKGGIKGDYIELTDAASGLWMVSGRLSATGTEVTPFSAAVT